MHLIKLYNIVAVYIVGLDFSRSRQAKINLLETAQVLNKLLYLLVSNP